MFPVIISIVLITITLMSSSIPRKDYEKHHPKLHYGIFRRESEIDIRVPIGIQYPNHTAQSLRRPHIYVDKHYSGREYRDTLFLFRKQRSAETRNNRKSDEWIQTMDGENQKSIAAALIRIEPKAISRSTPSDEDFYEAEDFGIRKMNELYSTGEPELYSLVLLFNESVPLILPFRTHLFFEVNNYFTLSLWWIYQFPMMFVNGFHPVSLCFAVFLIFHACGQLSALAIRIKNLGLELGAKTVGSGATFRHIVSTHYNITSITNDINDVFNLLFLEELFMTSVMIILTSYTVIVSTNVYEAYYQCQWYDLPDTYKKQLIICMIGSSKPIYLLGGSFYIFSLASFTNVLKTAMSYVSLLRSLI